MPRDATQSGLVVVALADNGLGLAPCIRPVGTRRYARFQLVQGKQPLVPDPRQSGFERRRCLAEEAECGVAVWLVEGFKAKAFESVAVWPRKDRWGIPRGAA